MAWHGDVPTSVPRTGACSTTLVQSKKPSKHPGKQEYGCYCAKQAHPGTGGFAHGALAGRAVKWGADVVRGWVGVCSGDVLHECVVKGESNCFGGGR